MSNYTNDSNKSNKTYNIRVIIERSNQREGTLDDHPKERAPPRKRRSIRLEKRVSIDLIPMTLQGIKYAIADAKMQDEDREVQEARERIRRKKEARAPARRARTALMK